jgi:hypothetical protein
MQNQSTNDKSLEITPTIAAHAGSQYFNQEYYKFNRVGNRKDNGNGQDQQMVVVRLWK